MTFSRELALKSLFLISSYANDTYDCLLSLYFLQKNIHFNFKSERDFMSIESKCVKMTIKNSSNYKHDDDFSFRFEVGLGLFFCFYLLCVVLLGLILLFEKPVVKENIIQHKSRGILGNPKSNSKWLLTFHLLHLKKKHHHHQKVQPII